MRKTMHARPAWFAERCKEQFDATDDDVLAELPLKYLHALLAIGASPERPPDWALQYFNDEFEARDQAPGDAYFKHRKVKRRAKRPRLEDGVLLDRVGIHRTKHKSSVLQATKAVAGDNPDRLRAAWKRERNGAKRIRRAAYLAAMEEPESDS